MRIYPRKNAPWTAREIQQLGRVPDSVLALRTQRTIKEVVAMQEQRRIFLPTPPRRWTVREIRMLGRYPDRELARRLRRPRKQIREERMRLHIAPIRPLKFKYWTTVELRLVGRLRDEEVAARTGHTVEAVHQKRFALRLPMPNSKIYRWNPEHDKLLGTRPDGEVTALLVCKVTSVEQCRRKLTKFPRCARLAARDQTIGSLRTYVY